MDCYIIPPLKHLDLMHLGDRYFCLAHLYYQYPHYRDFFKKVRESSQFVTLDNSAAERSLVTEDVLIEIVRDLKPNEVIAPDVLFNKEQTLKNLSNFKKRLKKEGLKVNIFGCPQGSSQREWIDCYETMLHDPSVAVIGLSKIAVPYCWFNKSTKDQNIAEARNKCIRYLEEKGLLQKPLHFLGMGDPKEFKQYNNSYIRSTDSCYTVLAAINDINFRKNFKRVETTNDYFQKSLTKAHIDCAFYNIHYLRTILREKEY